jgi:hypothetical protein
VQVPRRLGRDRSPGPFIAGRGHPGVYLLDVQGLHGPEGQMSDGRKGVVLDQEGITVVGGGPDPCPHLGKPVGEVVLDGKEEASILEPSSLSIRSRMLALGGREKQRGIPWPQRREKSRFAILRDDRRRPL